VGTGSSPFASTRSLRAGSAGFESRGSAEAEFCFRVAVSPAYPCSQQMPNETLMDFWLRRLECSKHLSDLLFETECGYDATRVYIERRDRADGDYRSSIAMVGRARNCRAGTAGASPHLQLRRTGDGGGHLPVAASGIFVASHAQGDSVPAAGVWDQPGCDGKRVFKLSPAFGRHSSLSADFGAGGGGPAEKCATTDVRYLS